MPGRQRLLGDPERQAAPPDQSRIIIGPVRHPIAHLGDLVAPVGIGFVGHGSISQRNQPVLRADARAVTRPAHNLRYIRAPTPKIRRLVDANIIGIFLWEIEGRIIEANDTFLYMVGHDREDIVSGRVRWTDLITPEWRARSGQAVEE